MKKLNLKKNKKGFTLVEIIVVLVIMGILLAIAVPSVLGYVNQANEQKYISSARVGFVGANTLVAREVAKNENITPAELNEKITVEAVTKEIGEKMAANNVVPATNTVQAIVCEVSTDKKITACDIKTADYSNYINFVTNQEATVGGKTPIVVPVTEAPGQ